MSAPRTRAGIRSVVPSKLRGETFFLHHASRRSEAEAGDLRLLSWKTGLLSPKDRDQGQVVLHLHHHDWSRVFAQLASVFLCWVWHCRHSICCPPPPPFFLLPSPPMARHLIHCPCDCVQLLQQAVLQGLCVAFLCRTSCTFQPRRLLRGPLKGRREEGFSVASLMVSVLVSYSCTLEPGRLLRSR